MAGYGGGMSSAKAALESDTRVLAYEAGRKFQIRVNTISAGPLGSRAAKAIGFIEDMIRLASISLPASETHLYVAVEQNPACHHACDMILRQHQACIMRHMPCFANSSITIPVGDSGASKEAQIALWNCLNLR